MPNIQTINDGESFGSVRSKINSNFGFINPVPIQVACNTTTPTTLDAATYANTIVELTVTGSVGVSASIVMATNGWAARDTVTIRIASLTTAFGVAISAPANTITIGTWSMTVAALLNDGDAITLRRSANNSVWEIAQDFVPIYATGLGGGPWLRGTGNIKANVSSTDIFWGAGYQKIQYSNNNTTGTALLEGIVEGTLSTNDVTGSYATISRARTGVQMVDYSGAWKSAVSLFSVPHYKVAGLFPAGMPPGVVGKRYSALGTDGIRYTDSKHWGGLIVGSITGALYNGVWYYNDEYGNFLFARGTGTVSEQRNTGTASFTVLDNTAQVAMAGSGTVTVTFPQVPFDGQDLTIFLETAYTGITLSGGALASTFTDGVIGVTAGSHGTWSYRAAGNIWRRKG